MVWDRQRRSRTVGILSRHSYMIPLPNSLKPQELKSPLYSGNGRVDGDLLIRQRAAHL
jgi:hypothetical protein